MAIVPERRISLLVFTLVGAGFTTLYLTQLVLPALRAEFAVDASRASLTVSAVVFGMALSNLPYGVLADRFPVRPIVLGGGAGVAAALAPGLEVLVALRFLQGLFLPALPS